MQAPTHILTGILLLAIFQVIFPTAPLWLQVVVVLPLSLASHFVIDAAAIFTYHPPKADWKDWFWVSYHLVIYIGSVVILVFFIVDYWWVIIAANFPDIIDWFKKINKCCNPSNCLRFKVSPLSKNNIPSLII